MLAGVRITHRVKLGGSVLNNFSCGAHHIFRQIARNAISIPRNRDGGHGKKSGIGQPEQRRQNLDKEGGRVSTTLCIQTT